MGEQPNPWDRIQPQDAMSRHRGAKPPDFAIFDNICILGHNINMKKTKIYLDTSFISHFQQDDAQEKTTETLELWNEFKKRNDIEIVISDLTLEEIRQCDEPKLTQITEILSEIKVTILEENSDNLKLAKTYLKNDILSDKSLSDLRHIAIAVMYECKYIVSWNFKHFVNPKTINAVSGLNLLNNLPMVNIVSPSMMLGGY